MNDELYDDDACPYCHGDGVVAEDGSSPWVDANGQVDRTDPRNRRCLECNGTGYADEEVI